MYLFTFFLAVFDVEWILFPQDNFSNFSIFNLHVQQTPKPEAQLPSLDPPFDEHSSLQNSNH